jgi:glycosyltransferase involved in cell wall biosynthesis
MPDVLAGTDIALVTLKPREVFKTVLPSKMFEAMAAARPIVLAVDGEARDTLERARAGIAVTPGDAAALARAIETLATDPAMRAQMGSAGAEFVEREFSRAEWGRRYSGILQSLAPAAARPARSTSKVAS